MSLFELNFEQSKIIIKLTYKRFIYSSVWYHLLCYKHLPNNKTDQLYSVNRCSGNQAHRQDFLKYGKFGYYQINGCKTAENLKISYELCQFRAFWISNRGRGHFPISPGCVSGYVIGKLVSVFRLDDT